MSNQQGTGPGYFYEDFFFTLNDPEKQGVGKKKNIQKTKPTLW